MAPEDQAPPNQTQTGAAADGGPFGMRPWSYAQLAPRLLDNGYAPLPIAPGKKHPVPKQWSTLTIDAAQVEAWVREFGGCGVGLRTGALVGIDLDIDDPDLAHAAAQLVEARLGTAPMRVGRWPRRLFLYRTDAPFAKLSITGVEVLGAGQQFVAFGRHPTTGRPYHWPLGDTPLDTPSEDLVAVDRDACEDLLGELAQLIPQGPANRRGPHGAPGANAGPQRDDRGLVADGRDSWLSRLAYHAVQDALEHGRALDAAALTEAVWLRFETTADLSRAKRGGSEAYRPADARRKVADKLQLLREDRLPPRQGPAVDLPDGPDALPIGAARATLDTTIEAACTRILEWRLGGSGPAPRIGVRATVGLGKSAVAHRRLLELRGKLLVAGAPSRILICTASHSLAEETAQRLRATGPSVAVLRGYEARHPTRRRRMCQDIEAVKAATRAGLDVQTTACAASGGRRCAFFLGCLKQANRDEVADADIVVAPYDALFTGFSGPPDTIGMILIDEGCWQRADIRMTGLQVETFPHAALNHVPRRARHGNEDAADLHDLRLRAAQAFEANGPGPVLKRHVRQAGLRAGDVALVRSLERSRLTDPGLYPGMPPDGRNAAMGRAEVNASILACIAVWEALQDLLDGEAETTGRVEIAARDAATGLRDITVLGVKPIHRNLTGLPILHLDATMRPELTQTILPDLDVEAIEAEAPFLQLRLITGAFGKSNLCADTQGDAAELARRSNRLAECVDYVRWHATRFERTLVVTYKDCEAAFAGIAGVEVAHFNAIAGLDAYRDVGLLVVIGRPLPRERDVRRLSSAFFGHVPRGGYRFVHRSVRMRDGQVRAVKTMAHSDPRAETLRTAICDDELIQAIGRGRGVNRTAADPLEVHVLADVALPLVHDRVLSWSTVQPDIVQRMLLAGGAVDSPSDAAALHPGLFGGEAQAQKAFERCGFRRHFPIDNTYREMSAKSAAYRRPGKGRPWQRCYWIEGAETTAKAALERAIGPIAEWRPE